VRDAELQIDVDLIHEELGLIDYMVEPDRELVRRFERGGGTHFFAEGKLGDHIDPGTFEPVVELPLECPCCSVPIPRRVSLKVIYACGDARMAVRCRACGEPALALVRSKQAAQPRIASPNYNLDRVRGYRVSWALYARKYR
jgi:hypothetical protein